MQLVFVWITFLLARVASQKCYLQSKMEDQFGGKTHPITILRPGVLLKITCQCDYLQATGVRLTVDETRQECNECDECRPYKCDVLDDRRVYWIDIGSLTKSQLGKRLRCYVNDPNVFSKHNASKTMVQLDSLCDEEECQLTFCCVCLQSKDSTGSCKRPLPEMCRNQNLTSVLCNGSSTKAPTTECELVASSKSPSGLLASKDSTDFSCPGKI